MKNYLILLFVFVTFTAVSQSDDIQALEKEKADLIAEKEQLKTKINEISFRLTLIEEKIGKIALIEASECQFICKTKTAIDAKFKDSPKVSGKVIQVIPKKSELIILEYFGDSYWKVSYKDQIGFMNDITLKKTDQMNSIKAGYANKIKQQEREKQKAIDQKKKEVEDRKLVELKKEFPKYWQYISNGDVVIGMNTEMVRKSIGNPDDINTSVGSWGTHEQWIYRKKDVYIYFENGIVTSLQF